MSPLAIIRILILLVLFGWIVYTRLVFAHVQEIVTQPGPETCCDYTAWPTVVPPQFSSAPGYLQK